MVEVGEGGKGAHDQVVAAGRRMGAACGCSDMHSLQNRTCTLCLRRPWVGGAVIILPLHDDVLGMGLHVRSGAGKMRARGKCFVVCRFLHGLHSVACASSRARSLSDVNRGGPGRCLPRVLRLAAAIAAAAPLACRCRVVVHMWCIDHMESLLALPLLFLGICPLFKHKL